MSRPAQGYHRRPLVEITDMLGEEVVVLLDT